MADHSMHRWRSVTALSLACIGFIACEACAADADVAVSGYATAGYARSNRAYRYDQYIDDHGTFLRDSVAGLQLDAKAFDDFGATVQVKAAPFTDRDNRYTASVSWAFLSYRPTNDWLFRIGKQRIPLYLYSETVDVGASYEFARLPVEMYSLTPSNDFVGGSIRRTFHLGDGEFAINALYGRSSNDFRFWLRDDIPQIQSRGTLFRKLTFKGGGVEISYKDDDRQFRIAVIRAHIRDASGNAIVSDLPWVSIAPGIGYYQVSDALPGPGVPTTPQLVNTAVTIGADVPISGGFRAIGEFSRAVERGTTLAPRGNRGYLALLRPIRQWTPYLSFAFIKSPQSQIDEYTALNDNALPAFVPGAATINASQRAGADQIVAYDQRSFAAGTSFALTPSSKLKAEFLSTRVGRVSQFVDAPAGATPRNLSVRTLSASYSVVFP